MGFRRHAAALLALAAITALWLSPVISQFSTAIPGVGAGDNVTFVWNIWWMRYALVHPGYSFFTTPFLFYPFGADLTLHTYRPARSCRGGRGPLVARGVAEPPDRHAHPSQLRVQLCARLPRD